MSKLETPLTKRYWQTVGGTLVLEFRAVKKGLGHAQRLLDGVIVLGGETKIANWDEVEIEGKDIVVVQAKAKRLGMYLLGQAVFSKELMKPFKPRSIRTVAICVKNDEVLEPLASEYGVEVVVYDSG